MFWFLKLFKDTDKHFKLSKKSFLLTNWHFLSFQKHQSISHVALVQPHGSEKRKEKIIAVSKQCDQNS